MYEHVVGEGDLLSLRPSDGQRAPLHGGPPLLNPVFAVGDGRRDLVMRTRRATLHRLTGRQRHRRLPGERREALSGAINRDRLPGDTAQTSGERRSVGPSTGTDFLGDTAQTSGERRSVGPSTGTDFLGDTAQTSA